MWRFWKGAEVRFRIEKDDWYIHLRCSNHLLINLLNPYIRYDNGIASKSILYPGCCFVNTPYVIITVSITIRCKLY